MINLRPELDIREGLIEKKKYSEQSKHFVEEL
jgi:hypothetical protein